MPEQNESCRYKKVMVVDDTYVDRYIAERIIRKYRFAEEIISVESAKDALTYLLDHANNTEDLPKFIFLDINMPEMNGFEFLEAYASLPEVIKQKCIVLMLTTSIHPIDKEKADSNPYVFQYLNKALDEEKLKQLREIS